MDSASRPRVKNKAAAPVQISAEQLLREAVSHQETQLRAPTTRFADLEELHEYQGRKRKEFEDYLRRNRQNVNNFTRYASWELEQREFARARSIFERALDVHATDIKLWTRYVDAELREKNIAHARNLLDRAVTILPRVNQLWFKYVRTEEALKDVARTREVYERWMKWQPDAPAWNAYVNFELRYYEADNARAIYKRYTLVHPEPATWLKYARFEMEFGTVDLVRKVFEDSMEEQTTEDFSEKLVIEFARFETRLEEFERARAIYKHFLDRVPRSMAQNLHKQYLEFEKQYGDTAGIEHVVLEKRRVVYEKTLKENPKDYDTWLDLAKLEEVAGDLDRIREVYERAIAEMPPRQEKRYWRRYIYIWLFYAAFEEIDVRDMQRVAEIYKQCLKLIPHKKFTFAKAWLATAYFHIRQNDVKAARLTLGQAIGMCPKNKVYREYIAMEVKLYEFNRCRKLYEHWLAFDQSNMKAWKGFAELERALDDIPRARAIYEIAIDDSMNSKLDMPEVIWKDYIDMEIDEGEHDNARKLYERLLAKTSHVKVWISYAQFEVNITADDDEDKAIPDDDRAIPDDDRAIPDEDTPIPDEDKPIPDEAKAKARAIFERANKLYKEQGIKEDRVALLQAWKSFEETHGTDADHQRLEKMMPQQVKKRRRLDDESFEEFVDWLFPADDEGAGKLAGLLARAKAWKERTALSVGDTVMSSAGDEKDTNGRANLGLDMYASDEGGD